MLALRCAPPVVANTEAERIIRDVYGFTVDVVPLPGERDANFLVTAAGGRQYVLKIADGAADPRVSDCQVRVLAHLAEQDPALSVPRILPTRDGAALGRIERLGSSHATWLLSYLPGRLLADVRPETALLHDIGATLARLDQGLRGFFHPALAQPLAWDVRRLPALGEYSACINGLETRRSVLQIVREFRERLPTLRGLRSQAIHGDCHGSNLLVDATNHAIGGVLDFGDMIHAPLILEAAVTLSELLTDGLVASGDLAAILEGYAGRQGFDPAEIAVLYDLITARHAVTILVHAWRLRHDPTSATVLNQSAARAARSLEHLRSLGRDALTRIWLEASGLATSMSVTDAVGSVDLDRRHRLLGSGAELFYDRPLHVVRGAGVWLYDADGHPHLDAYNNVPHVGHAHPTVVRAIQRQTARLATHTRYLHAGILDYAEQLTARCPVGLDACIFVNSGSEANDVAWRMAQFATGRQGAVVMAHAYHGITDAVAALTPGAGQPTDPRVVTLSPPAALSVDQAVDLTRVQDDLEQALRTLQSRGLAPAAFFLDSALTSSGIFDPPRIWIETVAARLRAAGSLVVGDEVQFGLGRSGSHFWGFERRGLIPDIVTLGKPIGNGYPMGVVIAGRSLVEAFQAQFGFFSTFGGNPVAAAAGLAVLMVLDRERLIANAHSTGAYMAERLQAVAARHPCLGRVRGTGFLLGLEVQASDHVIAKALTRRIVNDLAARHRVLIGSEGPDACILKLRPPMVLCPEHVDRLADAIDSAATAVES